jgi:folate-binding protein YgfZ
MPEHSTMISGESRAAYEAARHGAGLIDRSDRGRIAVSGKDRASYLQGLLTNDITALQAGEGCYAAYLTPQGRMIADMWVYELGDVMLLTLARDVKETMLAKLDQFIFTEDVQLGDVTRTFTNVAVVGPGSAATVEAVLEGLPLGALAALPEHGNRRGRFNDQAAVVLRVTDTGEPGFDVMVDESTGAALRASLLSAGAVDVDAAVADVLRVESGVPKFHQDMNEETIPLEAGLESRAISLTKGCYVGQEVIIRVLHRGHGRVARRLVGLTLGGGAVPPPGSTVRAEGREVGRVTSAVASLALGRPIALAYVHRDFVAPGTNLVVDDTPAVVTALPFVPLRRISQFDN